MGGWIKLHRKTLENPIIMKDKDYLAVWIFLLLNATHSQYDTIFNNKRMTLQKGQLITGRTSISEKLDISQSKVQRILKSFEIEHQIEQQTTSRNRLISIVNWEAYQQIEQPNEQQVNNKRTTSEQQVNTNKNNKNIKNDKNGKNGINNSNPTKQEEKVHFAEFVTMTNEEYQKLILAHSKEFADQCIEILDNYKGSTGKKYTSDYRAILSWVVNRVKENNYKQKVSKSGIDDFKELMEEAINEQNGNDTGNNPFSW